MLGKLKANAKAGHAGQGASFEEKEGAESETRKVSENVSGEHVVRLMKAMEEKHRKTPLESSNAAISAGSIPAIYSKTFKNKNSDTTENGLMEVNLFEDFLSADIDIVDCDLTNVQDNIKADCDINFGISPTLNTRERKLKLFKPRKAKPSTTEARTYCRPKPIVRANVIRKATCTKPSRIKKLPAKLTDTMIDSAMPNLDDVMLKIEEGPMPSKPSVINNALNVTLTSSNLTEIVNKNFVNKVTKVEKSVEKFSLGPLVNGVPNGKMEDHESKNLKITMTKVGDGVWEQVMKTTIKKRRYNSWKMGKLQKTKKKRKIEQTDHDYTSNYALPASQGQIGARNDKSSAMDPTLKSSPARRRITPNRLKDCVEVPSSPSKTNPTYALVPPLPSPQTNDQSVENSLLPSKTPRETKSSKKLMKIEAENLLKMSSRMVAKVNQQLPVSQVQLLPRVLARKDSGHVKRPRTYTKRATSKTATASNLKTELIAIPDTVNSSKTAVLDLEPSTDDANHQKRSPSKGIKVKKVNFIKDKKAQNKNTKTSTNKTLKKEKSSKVKASAVHKTAKVNAKVAKLTAKAKAIRLQIKAEKKKSQTACKAKAKAILKKKEVAVNANALNKTGSSHDNKIDTILSCEMPTAANASPKKMSLLCQLKKKNIKASKEDAKANVYVTSLNLPKHLKTLHSTSLVRLTDSSQLCKNAEMLQKTRGRPRSLISRPARQRSVRFSKNGIRIGRPPKATDGDQEESSLVGSQIQFLQSTLASCFSSSESSNVNKKEVIASPPDCLLPKNRTNAIRNRLPQSNVLSSNDALVPHPRPPMALSSNAFVPQSTLAANNPKRSSIRQTECAFR